MDEKLNQLINEFSMQLSKPLKEGYLPILRKFAVFILEKHKDLTSIEKLFQNEVTPNDIINAGVYYVDNTAKVTGEKAVDKYLTAISEFYNKIVFIKFPICSLSRFRDNFKEFKDDILVRSKKELKESKSHKHLTKADYQIVVEYLKSHDRDTYKELINKIIIKLILLYGFKIGIISELKKSDFSKEYKTIKIKNDNNKPIILELPYSISNEIENIIVQNPNNSDYLFLTEDGQSITSSYADDELKSISNNIKLKDSKKYTTTSFSKYAVIEMFVKGMNPIIISQISGMGDVNLKYCQNEANKRLNDVLNINRYVNSKIRDIATYDDFI